MLKRCDDTLGQRPGRKPLFPMVARGLTVRDGHQVLLDDVSLTLAARTCTVIMGANGAGKSVLLRVLHGLRTPDSGSVTWAGEPADAAVLARQAMVFQKPSLLRRSVKANITFVLAHCDRREAERRADAALVRANLTHLAGTPARLLSGGEQQRLAICRALVLDPDVLFLDEPSASLDPASTIAVEALIVDARTMGVKVILVTHDIGQAHRLADDIVFMSAGRVVESGAAASVFAAPTSAAARAYFEGRLHVPDPPAPG